MLTNVSMLYSDCYFDVLSTIQRSIAIVRMSEGYFDCTCILTKQLYRD